MSPKDAPVRALVTGASSGLGEVFARQLARRGPGLVLVARRRERLERLAAEQRLRQGDIDMLVNCAGFGTSGDFAGLSLQRELEEIDVNVRALVRLTHAALGPMTAAGRGAIINVASAAAFQPVPHLATYAASKAFVLHFSEALHEEVRGLGITVTCVCPGPVHTEFQQVAGLDERRLPGVMWMDPEAVVTAALRGAARRKAVVVPGTANAAATLGVRLAPRFVVRRMAGEPFRSRNRSSSDRQE